MAYRTLGITLARGGSKDVPRKNIREVGGRPLLAWTIEQAQGAGRIDDYVVSTDDEEIAAIAADCGAEIILRPEHLATDTASALDALLHALEVAEKRFGTEYEVVADVRNTNPLKTSRDIDACIKMLLTTGADVACGVSQMDEHHPMRLKRLLSDGRLVDIWPEPGGGNRQDLHPPSTFATGVSTR